MKLRMFGYVSSLIVICQTNMPPSLVSSLLNNAPVYLEQHRLGIGVVQRDVFNKYPVVRVLITSQSFYCRIMFTAKIIFGKIEFKKETQF